MGISGTLTAKLLADTTQKN